MSSKKVAVVETERVSLPVLASTSTGLVQNNAAGFLDELDTPIEQPVSMPVVTIVHDEESFMMPSGEMAEKISGYPVLYFQTRRFYAKAYSEGSNAPPDCWSADMFSPMPNSPEIQADTCADCPKASWGSAPDGKSQACAVQTWLFLLNPAYGNPPIIALVCPPSSIKVLLGGKFKGGYLSQARAAAGAFQLAYTEIGLERASKTHCVIAPRMVAVCTDPEEKKALAKLINYFRKPMDSARGQTPKVKVDDPETESVGAS